MVDYKRVHTSLKRKQAGEQGVVQSCQRDKPNLPNTRPEGNAWNIHYTMTHRHNQTLGQSSHNWAQPQANLTIDTRYWNLDSRSEASSGCLFHERTSLSKVNERILYVCTRPEAWQLCFDFFPPSSLSAMTQFVSPRRGSSEQDYGI